MIFLWILCKLSAILL